MRLILVSDTHLAHRAKAYCENWRAVRAWIEREPPDLVVHLGDVSADGANSPDDIVEAATYLADLPSEIRVLPGNHDIGDNPLDSGQPDEPPPSAARLSHHRAFFGDDRWSLTTDGWQLVGINAQLLNTRTEEEESQFEWLTRELEAARGPLGLMLHKPLFRNGPDDVEAHVRYVPASARRRLLALLASRDLRFVVSGHAHQARQFTVRGVEHVWAPATSFCMPDALQERIGVKRLGALELVLTGAAHRFREIAPPGVERHNLLDHPNVYPEVAAIRARLGARAAL